MGIHDRDYYQEGPKGASPDQGRMLVTNLVLVNVAIYVVDLLFLERLLSQKAALEASLLKNPWDVWQLLTHGFLHDPKNIMHIGGNMFCLWFFGRDLERIYGKKLFLQFYLSTIVLAGLGWVLAENMAGDPEASAIGASGAISGVILVYIFHFPRRTLMLFAVVPMPAWVLGIFIMGIDVAGKFDPQNNVAVSAHLAGAAIGYLFFKTRWHLGRLIPGRIALALFKPRPKIRIHDPDTEERKFNEKVDRILKKIHRHGEASLTKKEKRVLEDASRRYQQRQQ